MNLLVLSGYDDAMAAVGDLTAPSKQAYAERHGYEYLSNRHYTAESHPSWQKIRLLYDLLPQYDAVLWLDADTLVTNPEFEAETLSLPVVPWSAKSSPLETILPIVQIGRYWHHAGIVVSEDWSGCAKEDEPHHFSMGNFLITNCPESFQLLDEMGKRTQCANAGLWEQDAIQDVHRTRPDLRHLVKMVPRRVLNAVPFPEAIERWQPGDFLCHLTGIDNRIRLALIPEILAQIEE